MTVTIKHEAQLVQTRPAPVRGRPTWARGWRHVWSPPRWPPPSVWAGRASVRADQMSSGLATARSMIGWARLPPDCRGWRWGAGRPLSLPQPRPGGQPAGLPAPRPHLRAARAGLSGGAAAGIARQARLSAVICDGDRPAPAFGCPLRTLDGPAAAGAVSWPQVDDALAAYMMFTSGSTGEPKGVVISRRALLCFLDGIRERLGLSPSCHWLFITTPAFDISLLEMLGPLWAVAG